MLHALVRGAVFAQPNRVVREDMDHALFHKRCHADGVARIVRERQEGATVRDVTPMQRHAVHDGGHAKLAHAIREVVAPGVAARFGAGLEVGQVGARQVGAAAEKLGQQGGQHIQRILAGFASGHGIGLGHDGRQGFCQTLGVGFPQVAFHAALKFNRLFRVATLIGGKALPPLAFGPRATGPGIPYSGHIDRHFKGRIRPVQRFAGGGHFGSAQRCAVHIVGARFVG